MKLYFWKTSIYIENSLFIKPTFIQIEVKDNEKTFTKEGKTIKKSEVDSGKLTNHGAIFLGEKRIYFTNISKKQEYYNIVTDYITTYLKAKNFFIEKCLAELEEIKE